MSKGHVLAVVLAAACGVLIMLSAVIGHQIDGSGEPTTISWTAGDLPISSGDGRTGGRLHSSAEVQVYPRGSWRQHHHATPLGHPGIGLFRHYVHLSGPEACLFTADSTADGYLRNAGGGRDCPRSNTDDRCGFISEAFFTYVLAGGSCASFGIPACQGLESECW